MCVRTLHQIIIIPASYPENNSMRTKRGDQQPRLSSAGGAPGPLPGAGVLLLAHRPPAAAGTAAPAGRGAPVPSPRPPVLPAAHAGACRALRGARRGLGWGGGRRRPPLLRGGAPDGAAWLGAGAGQRGAPGRSTARIEEPPPPPAFSAGTLRLAAPRSPGLPRPPAADADAPLPGNAPAAGGARGARGLRPGCTAGRGRAWRGSGRRDRDLRAPLGRPHGRRPAARTGRSPERLCSPRLRPSLRRRRPPRVASPPTALCPGPPPQRPAGRAGPGRARPSCGAVGPPGPAGPGASAERPPAREEPPPGVLGDD
ncbi:translation initiation factor IF-2-like [Aquila chrysaetos chrysaetos]|uniref:translation initiation factor IF-2-like n=1 Tax=Aquila chrysaetos chrysaetos TaxID=223781 RepID=UPI001B7D30F8|nr:translation initiation factor IF-2-like [Aquila chrysaetos chrysaetos]